MQAATQSGRPPPVATLDDSTDSQDSTDAAPMLPQAHPRVAQYSVRQHAGAARAGNTPMPSATPELRETLCRAVVPVCGTRVGAEGAAARVGTCPCGC